jgi:hypothetical protein
MPPKLVMADGQAGLNWPGPDLSRSPTAVWLRGSWQQSSGPGSHVIETGWKPQRETISRQPRGTLRGGCGKAICRTADTTPPSHEHMGVDHARTQLGVPQEFMHRADIGSILQELCRERVASVTKYDPAAGVLWPPRGPYESSRTNPAGSSWFPARSERRVSPSVVIVCVGCLDLAISVPACALVRLQPHMTRLTACFSKCDRLQRELSRKEEELSRCYRMRRAVSQLEGIGNRSTCRFGRLGL